MMYSAFNDNRAIIIALSTALVVPIHCIMTLMFCGHLGSCAEVLGDLDRAMQAYEAALRMNPYSVSAMNLISTILRTKEQFPKAVDYLQSILNMEPSNGEIWGSLGHCYLMMDDLQKAYSAYQQALYHLRDPKVSFVQPRREFKVY